MSLKKYLLLSYLTLIGMVSVAVADPSAETLKAISGPFQPNYIVATPAELSNLFDLTYRIQMEPKLNGIFQAEFEELLEVPKIAQKKYDLPAFAETLNASQIMAILHMAPQLKDAVSLAVASMPAGKKISAKDKNNLVEMVHEEVVKVQVNQSLFKKIKENTVVSSPLAIETPDGKPGYYGAETYVNHEHAENPFDPNSRTIPGENILDVIVKFIDGAKHEVLINVYEFNVVEIEDALVRAHKRGVKLYFATDGDSIYSKDSDTEGKKLKKKEHLEIIERLQARTNHEITFRAVDTSKLNHQKLVVRDAQSPENAAVLKSSGNFMYSCLHPRGDGHNLPADVHVEAARPNPNHVTIVKGQTPAIIARQELLKTIVAGAKGSAGYPASGGFITYNQSKDTQEGKKFFLQTFSPNGMMGSINQGVHIPLIVEAVGPLLTAQYVFADDKVEDALVKRFQREVDQGKKPGFYSVGDGIFSMQTYSAFYHLTGLTLNPETRLYSENKDAPMVRMLPEPQLTEFRSNIRIAPAIYDDGTWVTLPGDSAKTKFSSILHHKLWLDLGSQISTPGSSFNTSEGAEGNQEQVTVTNDPSIFKKLYGAFRWLFDNASRSVYQEAQNRNVARGGTVMKPLKLAAPIRVGGNLQLGNLCYGFYKKAN